MENTPKESYTDAERLELAKKLDEDLDKFINSLEKRKYTEGWPEDRWQEEMEKHPFFMKNAPEAGDKLHPLMEGLQQLKYDPNENSPDELATAYKDDGNFNFKHGNYRLAIIAYTEGIKIKCGNPEIESTLYNNRSAANFFLKNYRSSLQDAELALKIKPEYDKPIIRAIKCCQAIEQYEKAIELSNKFLETNPNDTVVLDLKRACTKSLTIQERDLRKKKLAESKKTKAEDELMRVIAKSGVRIEGGKGGLKLEYLEPHVPELVNNRVHLNETGSLVWPVIFTYPEHRVMDFIQQFNSDDVEHTDEVFEQPPEWDMEKKYRPDNINVYYENHTKSKLHRVNIDHTLHDVLKQEEFLVRGGTPAFIIFAKASPAEKHFLSSYGLTS